MGFLRRFCCELVRPYLFGSDLPNHSRVTRYIVMSNGMNTAMSKGKRQGASKGYGQICPVAQTLDVIGERWALLILRDLFQFGPRKFQDLETSLARIGPNTLSARLKRLEASGIIEQRLYEMHPTACRVRPHRKRAASSDRFCLRSGAGAGSTSAEASAVRQPARARVRAAYSSSATRRTTTSMWLMRMPAGGSGRPSTRMLSPGMSSRRPSASTKKWLWLEVFVSK